MEGISIPFFQLEDDDFFSLVQNSQFNNLIENCTNFNISQLENILFDQFNDTNHHSFQNCPDNNYYNNFKESINQSHYILPSEIKNKLNSNTFSCCHLNINSCPKHFDEFKFECIESNDKLFDVIGLTETKLNKDIEHLFEIENFNCYNSSKSRHSGGIAMYIRNNLKNQVLLENISKNLDFIESLFIKFEINNYKVICGVVYHRPGSSNDEFINEMSNILEYAMQKCKYVYIMGDLNINLLNCTNRIPCNLIDLFHGYGIFSLINRPTRVNKDSCTLIDHIWSNCLDKFDCNGIIHTNISDHFPVFSSFLLKDNMKGGDGETRQLSFRIFNDDNVNKFKAELGQITWDLVFNTDNADVAFDHFFLFFKSVFDKNFPIVTKVVNTNHLNKPFIDDEIKKLIKEKDRIHKKYLKRPITFNKQYKLIRNKVNSLIKQKKNKYYREKLKNCSNDIKKTWGIINEILHRKSDKQTSTSFNINNKLVDDPTIIAHAFNDYYVNVGSNLAQSIEAVNISFEQYLGENSNTQLTFKLVNCNDILAIVKDLKDSAPGFDDIPASIIKKVIPLIVEPLCHICNCSLQGGVFPSKLKLAKVVPIYKKDEKDKLIDYRPISILSVFSKIIERVACDQLIYYLETNELLSNTQFGFREGRSTTAAALNLTDQILSAFDENKFTIGIFLDLKKAFETVDHNILIHKLHHLGISNNNLNFFKDYLCNRLQYLKFNNYESDPMSIKFSVPQGSNLGPILFIIYVNDIKNCINNLNNLLFADDTCLFSSGSNLNSLIDIINSELISVNNWLKANKLSLNVEKTSYIVFTRKKKIPPDISDIEMDSFQLNRVTNIKFLGFNITYNLSWQMHIHYLINKIDKLKGILYITRKSLSQSSKVLIYYTLIYSNIIYGNILWGGAPKSLVNKLFISQKKIIRTIMNVNNREHTNALFLQLQMLKVNEINILCTCVFVFKSLNGMVFPFDYFHFNFNFNSNYNLRNSFNLRPPFAVSSQSQRTPKYYGCLQWNSLPSDVVNSNSLFTFKRKLKLYLLNSYHD